MRPGLALRVDSAETLPHEGGKATGGEQRRGSILLLVFFMCFFFHCYINMNLSGTVNCT